MIEILNGVFYDPSKEWYLQDKRLIDLGLEIELTQPIGYEMENNVSHSRLKWAIWEHTTEMGTFQMRVDFIWLNEDIRHRNYLTKKEHNKVTITKIENGE